MSLWPACQGRGFIAGDDSEASLHWAKRRRAFKERRVKKGLHPFFHIEFHTESLCVSVCVTHTCGFTFSCVCEGGLGATDSHQTFKHMAFVDVCVLVIGIHKYGIIIIIIIV